VVKNMDLPERQVNLARNLIRHHAVVPERALGIILDNRLRRT
jgi:hypothetical protein